MCIKSIESYSCNHREEAPIPCEGFIENQVCTQQEAAKRDVVHHHDTKCPECKYFDEQMEELTNNPALSKPVERDAVEHDPKLYFTLVTRWHCGHLSDPKESNIERSPGDYQYLESKEYGSCSYCAELSPREHDQMKKEGKLEGDDPWGALNVTPQAAAGSSKEPMLNDVGALQASSATTPPPNGVPFDDIEEEEDEDAGAASTKGKGRRNMPGETYASRHGPTLTNDDLDDSGDEEKAITSSDEDEPARGRPALPRKDSSRTSSTLSHQHARKSTSPGQDHLESRGTSPAPSPDADQPPKYIEVSAEERAKLGLPDTQPVTQKTYDRLRAAHK